MQTETRKIPLFLNENTCLTKQEIEFIKNLNHVFVIYDDIKKKLLEENNVLVDLDIVRRLFNFSPLSYCLELEVLNDFKEIEDFPNCSQKIISVYNSPKLIKMKFEDFVRFINENEISTIFLETKNSGYFEMYLEQKLIENYSMSAEEETVKNILLKYINLYNAILDKLNIASLIEKTYFCVYNNFAFGCDKEVNSYQIDKDYILSAIAFMAKDEIERELNYLKEQLEKEKVEYLNEVNAKLSQIEKFILEDENFATCRSETDRMKYLRNILQNEPYEVIDYLEMEQTSTGMIRARGIAGKIFINRLWDIVKSK